MRKLKILLADDENEIATIVGALLGRAGHTIDVVNDGTTAILKLKESPGRYDLLITDGNMPEVSGIELIGQLPQLDFHGKVVLLSGYLTEDLEETYASLPIDRIIQKPFPLADLTRAVKEISEKIESEQPG